MPEPSSDPEGGAGAPPAATLTCSGEPPALPCPTAPRPAPPWPSLAQPLHTAPGALLPASAHTAVHAWFHVCSASNEPHTLRTACTAGTAYDGYLSACTVYLDASGDASLQAGSEPSAVLTDGAFSMQVGGAASGCLAGLSQ